MLTKGIESVKAYYSRMRDLWNEIDIIMTPPPCDYKESRTHIEAYQKTVVVVVSC